MKTRRHIKKYANRRLYDTVDSKHVTLADIRTLVVSGEDIKVTDDTTGEDITRPLLLQIIVDQEHAGKPMLSEMLLSQLIRFYGNPMQEMMSDYLQKSVDTFVGQQQSVQDQMRTMMSTTPLATMRELMRQNASTWESIMGMHTEDHADAGEDQVALGGRDPGSINEESGPDDARTGDPGTGSASGRPSKKSKVRKQD